MSCVSRDGGGGNPLSACGSLRKADHERSRTGQHDRPSTRRPTSRPRSTSTAVRRAPHRCPLPRARVPAEHSSDAGALPGPRQPDERARRQRLHALARRARRRAAATGGRAVRLGALDDAGRHAGAHRRAAPHDPRLLRLSARTLRGALPGERLARRWPRRPARSRALWRTPTGASTTARGRCSCTCGPTPTFRCWSCRSTWRRRPRRTSRSGRRLAPLRDHGVLVLGSGNIVHNLRAIDWDNPDSGYDWAVEFDGWVRDRLLEGDAEALAAYRDAGRAAQLSVPTPDHYLPLLAAAGAADGDSATFVVRGHGAGQPVDALRALGVGGLPGWLGAPHAPATRRAPASWLGRTWPSHRRASRTRSAS